MAADFDESKHPRAGKGEGNGGQFVAGSGGGGASASDSSEAPKGKGKPAKTPAAKPAAQKPSGSDGEDTNGIRYAERVTEHPDFVRSIRSAAVDVDDERSKEIAAGAAEEFFGGPSPSNNYRVIQDRWNRVESDAVARYSSSLLDQLNEASFDGSMSQSQREEILASPEMKRQIEIFKRDLREHFSTEAEPSDWAIRRAGYLGEDAFRSELENYSISDLSSEWSNDETFRADNWGYPATSQERDEFTSRYEAAYEEEAEADRERQQKEDEEDDDTDVPNDAPSEIDPALVPDKHRDKERPETPADRSLDGAERLKGDDWLAAAANQGAKTRWAKTQIVNDVFPDGAPDLERLASVWASDTHTIEINTVDTRTEDDGGSAVVLSGEIVDDTATKIGEITRSFIRHPDGSLEVHHDYFRIDRSSKLGQGGGAAMMGQALEAYEQLGVDKVTVQAAWIGKYTWASFGYDWSASEADNKQDELERFLREHNVANADRIARAASRHAYDVARLDIPGVTHQFTRQQMMNISGTTDAPPTTPDPMPIGKAFLMQCDGWEGTITLSDKASGSYQHAAKRLKLKGSVASPAAAPPPAVHGPGEQLKIPGMKKLSRRAAGRRILNAMQPPRQPAPDSMADMMEAEADAANAADAFPLDGLEDVPPEAVPTEAEKPSALEPPPKPPTSRVVIPAMRPEPGEAMEAFAVRVADALRSAAKSAKPKKGKPAGVSSEAKSRDPSNGDKPTVSGPPPKPQPGVPGSDLQEEFREYAGNKPVQRPV